MAKRSITLRLSENLLNNIQGPGESVNAAVESTLDRFLKIRSVSLNELKGRFSSYEWKFLADCFNGTIVDSTFCANPTVMAATIEDHARFNGADSRWGVELASFTSRISILTGAQVEAVYFRIDQYWAKHEDINLDEWSQW